MRTYSNRKTTWAMEYWSQTETDRSDEQSSQRGAAELFSKAAKLSQRKFKQKETIVVLSLQNKHILENILRSRLWKNSQIMHLYKLLSNRNHCDSKYLLSLNKKKQKRRRKSHPFLMPGQIKNISKRIHGIALMQN